MAGPTMLDQSGLLSVYLQVEPNGPMLGLGQEYKGERSQGDALGSGLRDE